MSFFQRQINEVAHDPALRLYGACLAAINSLSAYFWLTVEPIDRVLAPTTPPVCWPFVPGCTLLRIMTQGQVAAVVWVILCAGLINSALFASPRLVRVAYWALFLVTAMKCALIVQDYRLIHNEHYMANSAIAVFLFVPTKRVALKYIIVLFYVWAGLLKLNMGWISGAALYGRRPLGIPGELVPAACAYVIVLELFIVFGLLATARWALWTSLAQLVLFHVSSFWVVGFFYPLLMFLILALFPLCSYIPSAAPGESDSSWFVPPGRPAIWVILSFSVLQCIPRLYPGRSALTGEGRAFALHMFDAPVQCRAEQLFHLPSGETRAVVVRPPFVYPRTACDPLVFFELATDYCRTHAGELPLIDFDLTLRSRTYGQTDYVTIVSIMSFCATKPTYTVWRHNPWIHTSH